MLAGKFKALTSVISSLASAIKGKADLLVTGDSDLLMVAEVAPLPIVDPREAWLILRR